MRVECPENSVFDNFDVVGIIEDVIFSVSTTGIKTASQSSAYLLCPDDTWIYDSTTNRCFKAFAAKPIAGGVCTKDAPCVDVGAPYELPSSLAYTLNLQALLDAAAIGIATNVQPVDEAVFYVGISDPLVNDQYQLDDGTPLPYSTILPYFTPTNPSDDATNVFKVMTARVYLDGLGLDDDTCTSGPLLDYGSICQIQLS
uniref:Uncharacterized protein n=1 Tax=Plectus sambesii TaxID=2011161 RepID=A0A914VW99_9BILA